MQNPIQSFEINEVEIVYKRTNKNTPKITGAKTAANILRNQFPANKMDYKEFFYVMLLSQSNEVLGVSQIGMGSTAGVVVNVKEIFQLVLKTNATGIILCHNHPSGSLKSSGADHRLEVLCLDCLKLSFLLAFYQGVLEG